MIIQLGNHDGGRAGDGGFRRSRGEGGGGIVRRAEGTGGEIQVFGVDAGLREEDYDSQVHC